MLLEQFRSYLLSKNIGFNPINNEMIHFKMNHLDYVFQTDDRDAPYLRLILPNVLDITNNNRIKLREFMAKMNAEFKVGKIVEVENSLWITAELFVYSPIGLNSLFERLIQLLEQIHNKISSEVQHLNIFRNDEQN